MVKEYFRRIRMRVRDSKETVLVLKPTPDKERERRGERSGKGVGKEWERSGENQTPGRQAPTSGAALGRPHQTLAREPQARPSIQAPGCW